MPLAIQIHELGGKARTVYGFDNVVINGRSEIRRSVPSFRAVWVDEARRAATTGVATAL